MAVTRPTTKSCDGAEGSELWVPYEHGGAITRGKPGPLTAADFEGLQPGQLSCTPRDELVNKFVIQRLDGVYRGGLPGSTQGSTAGTAAGKTGPSGQTCGVKGQARAQTIPACGKKSDVWEA